MCIQQLLHVLAAVEQALEGGVGGGGVGVEGGGVDCVVSVRVWSGRVCMIACVESVARLPG